MPQKLTCSSFLPTGTGISRAFSPESSSDSGNETNSSEMTESSEQTAAHRLSENAMRLLVATTEGYQPLQEEKTEFPISPCTRGSIPKPPRSPSRRKDLAVQPTTVPSKHNLPSSDNPETEPEAKADKSLGKYLVKSHSSTLLNTGKRLKAMATEGRRIKKNKDAPGKYNTFSGRESNRRRQLVVKEFCERFQGLQSPTENEPSGSQVTESRGSREDLTGSNISLPTKKLQDTEQTDTYKDDQQILPPLRQGMARLCEYHLAKRISSLQNEALSSRQSSQSSSLDVGGSTGSSASATPVDSPHCATDCKSSFSGSSSSLKLTARDLHPHADAALLRKMLPNVHPPGSNPPLSVRPSKIKETTGTARRSNLLSDLHEKHGSTKSINTMEGSEAYRQLINYLTVSQMHQGGKLFRAELGGGKKRMTNPSFLLDKFKGKGNIIIKCPCMPPSPSLLVSTTPSADSHRIPKIYHSTTLPAKFKRSPDLHAQRPVSNLDVRPNHSERRRSYSGLNCELEQNFNLNQFSSLDRNHSEGIPHASTDDLLMSDCKMTLAVQQTLNDSFCLSSVAGTEDRGMLLRGEGDSPANLPRHIKTYAVPLPPPPPPPPLSLPPPPTLPPPPKSCLSKSTSYIGPTQESLVPLRQNHLSSQGLNQYDTNSPNRGREIRRSTSIITAGSGNIDALMEKSRAPSLGRIQQDHLHATEPQLQRRTPRNKLSKSYSQGSVASQTMGWSVSNRDSKTDCAIFPVQKDTKQIRSAQRLDINPWTCNGPFSYCFFKKKNQSVEDEGGIGDGLRRQLCGLDEPGPSQYNPDSCVLDTTGEQLYAEVLNNMTFGDRMLRINALKEHTNAYPAVFTDVRRDASELIAVVRSSVGRSDRGTPPMQTEELAQYKHLLAIESKALGQACRRMAQAHSSPEEMLLAVSSSFQVLCSLSEICMCLVRGLGASASQQQREVVAKVDEVVMNYMCLLRAAEGASGSAPGDQSVKTLDRHSSTMSAIINTLTRSLKTLLNK